VTGTGVILGLGGAQKRVCFGDEPLRFDGGAAPACRLIDGPTRDLNLMIRGGTGAMQGANDEEWKGDAPFRALFTAVPGRWSNGQASRDVPVHTLVWDDAAAGESWRFKAHTPVATPGWWIIVE
jgi:environmental stress-induced protein Ves